MPHILNRDKAVAVTEPSTVGELTYAVARLLNDYVRRAGYVNYELLAEAEAGALGAAKEFRRQVIDPYEDEKIRNNGNAFDGELTGYGQ